MNSVHEICNVHVLVYIWCTGKLARVELSKAAVSVDSTLPYMSSLECGHNTIYLSPATFRHLHVHVCDNNSILL